MKKILLMGWVSTTGMTLFSYVLSLMFKERFLETAQLNRLIYPHERERKKHHPAGFILHYLAGTFFSTVYYNLWKRLPVKSDALTSSAFGFMNGIIGIAGWHSIFLLHPNPPKGNRLNYYIQLLAAHVIFGYLNGKVYRRSYTCWSDAVTVRSHKNIAC